METEEEEQQRQKRHHELLSALSFGIDVISEDKNNNNKSDHDSKNRQEDKDKEQQQPEEESVFVAPSDLVASTKSERHRQKQQQYPLGDNDDDNDGVNSSNEKELLLRNLIPDWIDDNNDDDDGDEDVALLGVNLPSTDDCNNNTIDKNPFSCILGNNMELCALILSYAPTLQDIAFFALTSRFSHRIASSQQLWKIKWEDRYNVNLLSLHHNNNHNNDHVRADYKESYQNAHQNTHDLWIHHGNIVPPQDQELPGRCCILPPQQQQQQCSNGEPCCGRCPACRYRDLEQRVVELQHLSDDALCQTMESKRIEAVAHGLLLRNHTGQTTITKAKAIRASTEYSIVKYAYNTKHLPTSTTKATTAGAAPRPGSSSPASFQKAKRAFEAASTFYRPINTQQYATNALTFLTDAIFLKAVEDGGGEYQQEEQDLIQQELYGKKGQQQEQQQVEENDDLDVDANNNIGNTHNDIDDTAPSFTPGLPNTLSHLGLELTQHTWHVVHFTNPDFVRPITFRTFVQRPDCFTVFPSEGYLEPGETCSIVLGVKLLGGLVCQAFEALNAQREQVHPTFLASVVYAQEAHLPYAPFCVRYMIGAVPPCIPPLFSSRGDNKAFGMTAAMATAAATARRREPGLAGQPIPGAPDGFSNRKSVIDYLWEHVATEATVRSQHISAHVHAHYTYDEFARFTLQPWALPRAKEWSTKYGTIAGTAAAELKQQLSQQQPQQKVLVYSAPNLMLQFPAVFHRLQNIRLEMELSQEGEAYRTEQTASCLCGRQPTTWGARAEELARTYVLHRLEMWTQHRLRQQQLQNLVILLRAVYRVVEKNGEEEDWERVYQMLYVLHETLTSKRLSPLVSKKQRKLLFQFEVVVDELCQTVQMRLGERGGNDESETQGVDNSGNSSIVVDNDEDDTTWRTAGVYRHLTCTDSVFAADQVLADVSFPGVKEEPDYLDGFRHLCHNPGLYCLGQQQDPNHEDAVPTSAGATSNGESSKFVGPFHPKKREKASDIFMDDTTLSFASALAMVHDPRSLLVHGVFDWVRFPGSIARRPRVDTLHVFAEPEHTLNRKELLKRAKATTKRILAENAVVLSKQCSDDGFDRFKMNDLDPDGLKLLHLEDEKDFIFRTSFDEYIHNIPPPGVGKYPFGVLNEDASRPDDDISELVLDSAASANREDDADGALGAQEDRHARFNVHPMNPALAGARGPRLFNLLWVLSSHLGWSIHDNQGGSPVLVDRRILIASQWVANSSMAMPLLYTLLARSVDWISPKPINYHLEGLPYDIENEMRYFSSEECRYAAATVFCLWLVMGRYSERKIGRTFERSMVEHMSNEPKRSIASRIWYPVSLWLQRRWDRMCPIFLQQLVFTPRWNRRTHQEVQAHISAWRSKDRREHRSIFPSAAGRGVMAFGASVEDGGPPVEIWEESTSRKLFAGMLVALGSFCACSPHFILNVLTVFCCSIGLGMSVSLQSMEAGRGILSLTSTPPQRSIFRPFGLNTIVIGFFLIGQLVGSSGGVLFLAEFVVTSVSLILGGAGTISASAMESWACFFCLSATAFWGYLFARVALIDGIRQKRRSASGVFLCTSLVVISVLWMVSLVFWEWDVPANVMINRNIMSKTRRVDGNFVAQHLQ